MCTDMTGTIQVQIIQSPLHLLPLKFVVFESLYLFLSSQSPPQLLSISSPLVPILITIHPLGVILLILYSGSLLGFYINSFSECFHSTLFCYIILHLICNSHSFCYPIASGWFHLPHFLQISKSPVSGLQISDLVHVSPYI